MNRFYCPDADLTQSTIEITDPKELHHLKNVLRLKKDGRIKIFDGKGMEILGTILISEKSRLVVRRDSLEQTPGAKKTFVELACAIPKKAKFEFIIEKCTELDVDKIIPLLTERTEVSLKEERAKKKSGRYQTVAVNAAKQCGRTTVPEISSPIAFQQLIQMIPADTLTLLPCLKGERKDFFETFASQKIPSRVLILIGPEGDFTDEELDLALQNGCLPVTLGKTVLKVDTAALTAVSWIRLFLDHESQKQ